VITNSLPLDEYCNGNEFVITDLWSADSADLMVRYGPSTFPGHIYDIDTETFHALTSFEPGTMTLVVYGPLRQQEIVCFNQLSGRVERRCTATNAKNQLIKQLNKLCDKEDC
jgi:hypothetical protein